MCLENKWQLIYFENWIEFDRSYALFGFAYYMKNNLLFLLNIHIHLYHVKKIDKSLRLLARFTIEFSRLYT